jgi:D-alanine-D-alanine ligase
MRIALIYNQPAPSAYDERGESAAENGVMDAVAAVRRALKSNAHQIIELPLAPTTAVTPGILAATGADVVFNLFEGFAGKPESEAEFAGLLAESGLPFTGSAAPALALTLNKAATHQVLQAHGLRTPRFQLLMPAALATFNLSFPCIVKPAADDASHGMSAQSVVFNPAELAREVGRLETDYPGQPALVEEFLNGREFNATVWGVTAPGLLPVSEIVYTMPPGRPNILTFAAKWQPDSDDYRQTAVACPARLEARLEPEIRTAALTAFSATGCRGYARIDFRLDRDGRPVILEVNANPDLSPDAGVARQARAAGIDYDNMVTEIINFALEAA